MKFSGKKENSRKLGKDKKSLDLRARVWLNKYNVKTLIGLAQ